MDNQRFFLLLLLIVLGMFIVQAWQADYGTEPSEVVEPNQADGVAPPAVDVPDPNFAQPASEPAFTAPATTASTSLVTLSSDVLLLQIDPKGASIVRGELLQYPIASKNPDKPFVLLEESAAKVFVADSGLITENDAVDHHVSYRPVDTEIEMSAADDRVAASFVYQNGSVEVVKTIRLQRGSYIVETDYTVKNIGAEPWSARPYQQLKRSRESGRDGFLYTYTGAVLSTPENHYKKYSFKKLIDKPISANVANGWVAFIQHYFLTALIPTPEKKAQYYSKAISDDLFVVGTLEEPLTINPGETAQRTMRSVVGPKLQRDLKEIAPHLDLSVDYGWVWFIAKPLFWLLDKIHSVTGNWGFAIILVTIILKTILFPLSAAGYRSMANMRKLQPRLVALKERYGDDRQKMNQAMLEMYKTEKVNPLGGCFPILIQLPVFLALYWVLLESVELRQAPFALWIQDLSAKDPLFVLPLLMGLSMWFQQKLSPAPMDPVQARVMQLMPIMMTAFFAFFPAGLVLYWVVNNVLSIAQQWYITRQIERAS